MEKLTICRDDAVAFTTVPNYFIDKYMPDANDAQLKVYLYLLRCFQAHTATSVPDMADKFNDTEKDILRAIKYWEKKKLIALEYDTSKNLTGIRFLSSEDSADSASEKEEESPVQSADIVPLPAAHPAVEKTPAFEKPSYSLDELKTFKNNEESGQLLFIVEEYIGRPLTSSEMRTILFIYDKLGFSADLIDYLVQYCVEKGKREFRYIEKVAVNWAENNITTPRQAKSFARKYDKAVYTVMKALGKTNAPTPKEAGYISKWTKEYGFSLSVIEAACEKTVLATDKHRFEYADRILLNWLRSQVHTLEDIHTADVAYQKRKTVQPSSSILNNQFNQFPQRDYDFDALEKELLSN